MRRLGWAALWIGFGLGGFFDGILLHQILQWHHLLSNVLPDETVADLRVQVLADGVFHVATYAFTILGLWLLWTARGALPRAGARQRVIATGLIGFGIWHIADAILFHWTLRLHRIRMDADSFLLWTSCGSSRSGSCQRRSATGCCGGRRSRGRRAGGRQPRCRWHSPRW